MKSFVLLCICSVFYLWLKPESNEPVVVSDYRFQSVIVTDTAGVFHDDFDSSYVWYGNVTFTFKQGHNCYNN